jgi:hypothetical protein
VGGDSGDGEWAFTLPFPFLFVASFGAGVTAFFTSGSIVWAIEVMTVTLMPNAVAKGCRESSTSLLEHPSL